MTEFSSITDNENLTICSECGGACCKTKPGIDSPAGYLADPDPGKALASRLASGKWVLDRHYGLPPEGNRPAIPAAELTLFYPRPAVLTEVQEGRTFGDLTGGECCLLGKDGCLLSFEERPMMCRALHPEPNFNCSTLWDRRHAALAWYHYQPLIREALTLIGIPVPDELRKPFDEGITAQDPAAR